MSKRREEEPRGRKADGKSKEEKEKSLQRTGGDPQRGDGDRKHSSDEKRQETEGRMSSKRKSENVRSERRQRTEDSSSRRSRSRDHCVRRKREEEFPRRMQKTILHMIWKKKGRQEVLKNNRFIHMKDYLSRTCEALVVGMIKQKIFDKSSIYQIGGPQCPQMGY